MRQAAGRRPAKSKPHCLRNKRGTQTAANPSGASPVVNLECSSGGV